METIDKELLLQGAVDIAEDILSRAKKTPEGIYWEFMTLGEDRAAAWEISHSIYSGVSGIVLFYLELHKQTGDDEWFNASKEAINWLTHYLDDKDDAYFALITGRLGSAITIWKMGDYTQDQALKDKAVQIALKADAFLDSPMSVDDLINGIAGTMLGLVTLYDLAGDKRLLDLAELFAKRMLEKVQITPEGLYWDRGDKHIRGLCGYSHGAAGIASAWLELGNYFDHAPFKWLSKAAFEYENKLYNADTGNWPDYRKGIYDEASLKEYTEHYRSGNHDFFFSPGDMAAWCHGAPGVGLSRIRAHALTGESSYLEDAKKAITKTQATLHTEKGHFNSYTLCHGKGGNSMLLVEAFKENKDEALYQEAYQVAIEGIKSKQAGNNYISGYSTAGGEEDISLFMGNAGIGYFYLMVREPLSTPNILVYDLGESHYGGEPHSITDIDMSAIVKAVGMRMMGRTLQFYEAIMPEASDFFEGFEFTTEDIHHTLLDFARQKIDASNNELLKDVFMLDRKGAGLDLQIKSQSYISLRHALTLEDNQELLEKISDAELREKHYELPDDFVLVETEWDWLLPTEEQLANVDKEPEGFEVLLTPSPSGTLEHPLNQFSYLVLESFQEKRSFGEALKIIIGYFEPESDEQIEQIAQATIEQIKEAVSSGFLLVHSD